MDNIYKNFINGEWIVGKESPIPNINPSDTSDVIGICHGADSTLIDEAVNGARQAQKQWALTNPEARSDILMKIGNELIARQQELGELLAREEGKVLNEGIGEVNRAGRFFHYFAAEALRQTGCFVDSVRTGVEIEVMREAVGTVLLITPWNFPMALPAWKIAPALAFGNSVLLKPSELTPACACALTDIIHRAGVPTGVFQLLLGSGAGVGNDLLNHTAIDAVSFTGSLPTGRIVARTSAEQLRRFQLEMGSKNALIVLDDCAVDDAVNAAVNGAFFGTGQKCTASSRIIVTEAIYASFLDRFIAATAALKVGHALSPKSQIGPAISQQQLEKNHHYIQLAQKEGATLAFTGTLDDISTTGYYCPPTLFTETTNQMTINVDEVFGPITCIIKVKNYEEALTVCNDSAYGLTAGIMTTSLQHATHFKRNAQSGCVMVNLPTAGTDYHVPFGGTKQSSFGPREQGQQAVEFYTVIKTVYLRA